MQVANAGSAMTVIMLLDKDTNSYVLVVVREIVPFERDFKSRLGPTQCLAMHWLKHDTYALIMQEHIAERELIRGIERNKMC